ncbi:MAG: SusC/RagA family TonB-linked outer membrane protein [Bacteroidales bacterium]|nr:SusC/RagA family TonB-linked outer membrane protein [Bacteroidales bacterium]
MKRRLLIWSMLFFYALPLLAQNPQLITVDFKNEPTSKALQTIEKQTHLNFVYNVEHLKALPTVTYSGINVPLGTALATLFSGKLSFTVKGNTIVLSPIENEPLKMSGVVVDRGGLPLVGVTIVLQGSKRNTITDLNGLFTIEVANENAKLVFSCIGFEEKTVSFKEFKGTVTMMESTTNLDEVVVTGIFQKAITSFTGAATVIRSEELLQYGNRNLLQSLKNIDPSINILENNIYGSNPNHLPELQIRGNSSIPNVDELKDETRVGMNTPLIILDGFESTLQKLIDINENEVESLTILKDASATSLYGSRGANGVIVITTKMPAMGKLKISYRGDLNIETPDLSDYDVLDAREKIELEKRVGLYDYVRADDDWELKQYYNYILNEVNSGVNTYWLSKPLRLGVGQKHNVRLEGGDKTFRYSASAQYNDVEGVMKESYRKVFNGSINLSYYLKNVKFSNSTQISLSNTMESPYGNYNQYVMMNPYWKTTDENGKILKTLGDPGNEFGSSIYQVRWSDLPTNPLYNATLNTFDKSNSTDIINNFSIEWKVISALTLRARLGLTKTLGETDVFKPADHTDFANYSEENMFRKGSYRYGTNKGFTYDGSFNASFNKCFAEKHIVYAGFDYNIRQNRASNYSFLAEGFGNQNLDFISMALQYAKDGKPSGSESMVRSIGITANVNYTYDNRYYVDLSGRTDGSSQFGSNTRFAPFYAAGIGWNIHNESFLEESPYINFLKLRLSVGTNGSQKFSAYQALSTYKYFTNDKYFEWLGASLMGLGNSDLRWQQKLNYNIGLESKFFNNRLAIIADFYKEKTTDLISSIDIPAANGFSSYVENIGEMENKGFELKATAFLIRNTKSQIYWNITVAGIHNRNQVVEVSQALLDAQKSIEEAKTTNPNILYKPGYSTNTIWAVRSLGINPGDGKEIYLDKAGNVVSAWNAADIVDCGSAESKLQGVISTIFRYKALTFNASFSYRFGGKDYNNTLIDKVENANYDYNVDSRVWYGRWNKAGDISAFKGLDVVSKTYATSRFVQNNNVFSCNSLSLQYELKTKKIQEALRIENILFGASTSDLFYLSSIKRERGLYYPFSRQFNFSVNITF